MRESRKIEIDEAGTPSKCVFEPFFRLLFNLVIVVPWVVGVVLAQGWLKLVAFVFVPYAWYLMIEKLMQMNGWI